jgi:PAS domain S-box-containing protein
MTLKRCPICARTYPSEERFCSVHGLPLVGKIASTTTVEGELTGHVLDSRYCLGGVAGRGGMGVVYEAEHLRIGRRCAVKVLHQDLHADAKMRMRLFREVQATSRVRHPNVVEILDFGDDEVAGSYLVMEFLDGQSLTEIIRTQAPLPLSFAFKMAIQLTAALSATHSHGLIHRDLKPSNIRLLPTGVIKVLDFGLVKPFEPDTAKDFVTITTGGMAFGTPWYMSPEQASFQPLGPRSDIYSLGIVLYEMITGRLPFRGDNPLELIDAHRTKPVPLPSALEPPVNLPAGLEMLLIKALSKDPDQRYQTMVDLMDALYLTAQQANIPVEDLQANPRRILVQSTATPEAEHDWTLPIAPTDLPIKNLHALVMTQLDEIVVRIVNALRAALPRYRTIDTVVLSEGVRLSLETAIKVFDDDPLTELPADMRRLADQRSGQEFTPTEIIGAMWMELSMLRPLLREVTEDSSIDLAHHEELLDQRMLSFVLKMVDYYFSSYHGRLTRLNEALSRQNDELMHLRAALTEQVNATSQQLQDSELLKARVVENISSGLVLIDHQTQMVRIFNKAMERLSGFPAREALGRPIQEVLTFVEGVPYNEFREQIQLHGEVGLRKLWIRFASGIQHAVYLRGQVFRDQRGQHAATLFIVDDVTEREQIIESFSRYPSRDVVDRVLQQGNLLNSEGHPRSAAVLFANIINFRHLMKKIPPLEIVALLSDYIRAIGDAVFHFGGTIETAMADGVLVYFDLKHGALLSAVNAARDLLNRLEAINEGRRKKEQTPIQVSIGLHLGEVLVVNVGSSRHMVHTVVGDVATVAQALQNVGSASEILLSSDVAKALGDTVSVENGPMIAVEGHEQPIEAFRLSFEPEPLNEPTLF